MTLRARRHQPQRPGPGRRHPRRRPPPLRAGSRCSTAASGRGCGPGTRARPRQPGAGAARPQARPRPRQHRHRHRRRRDRQQLRRHALRRRRTTPTSTVRALTLRPAVGDGDRHRGARTPRSSSPRAEPELARGPGADPRRDPRRRGADCERIRRKFEIKNTTGYRLCAFLDADEPLEIFRRLLVGSEGTLAFIAEAVFETVPLRPPHDATWVHFPDIDSACEPVPELVAAGASAVELMVAPALIVAAHNIPGDARALEASCRPRPAALLVEFRAEDGERPRRAGGDGRRGARRPRAAPRRPSSPATREGIELYWRVREGMHGLIGKLRPPGTALIIEDVCVPPARIAESAEDIQALLGKHGFLTGVAGHTSAGQPPLHAHPGLLQAGGPRALRGVHGRARRADRRQVRRLAQGRARDRPQHGALRRARVGREGDRADVADQVARRPGRRARARRAAQPRPRRPPRRT